MKRFSAAALLLAAFSAHAAEDGITAERPWMRPTAIGTGAVYLTLRNTGAETALLTGIDCGPATCMIHRSEESGGTMSMSMLDSLAVPARGEAVFKPGALHIMVMGLKAPLAEGATFPITLHFKDCADLSVPVAVRKGAP
jgi:copper(I)-binding protein